MGDLNLLVKWWLIQLAGLFRPFHTRLLPMRGSLHDFEIAEIFMNIYPLHVLFGRFCQHLFFQLAILYPNQCGD